jgi:hypothetical protein
MMWQTSQCHMGQQAACDSQAQALSMIVRDPLGVAGAMFEPIKQDFVSGNPNKATGRVVEMVAEALVGTHGAGPAASAVSKTEAAAAAALRDAAEASARESAAARAAKAAGLACSFAGPTDVLMADGTYKPIQDIKPGDKVIATDPKTGERAAKTVLQVWEHNDTLTDLVVAGGKVTTTEDHPFWSVTDNRFERADQLAPGETVLGADGRPVRVVGLAPRTAHDAQAYNLTVAEIHTYYVGAGRASILVHNEGGWDVPDDYVIVRGGQSDMPGTGEVFSGSMGTSIEEAGGGVPHGSIRSTTAGAIRAAGGSVVYAPEPTATGAMNYNHVNVTLGHKNPFGELGPNPVAKKARLAPESLGTPRC